MRKRIKVNVKKQKRGFFKAVKLIIFNKANTDGELTIAAFSYIIHIAFKLVAVIGTALSIGVIGTSICRIVEAILNRDNILQSTLTFVIVIPVTLAIMLYMLILWGSANEIEKETDRNYIVSVFSSIVSFAALIVALVALYKS